MGLSYLEEDSTYTTHKRVTYGCTRTCRPFVLPTELTHRNEGDMSRSPELRNLAMSQQQEVGTNLATGGVSPSSGPKVTSALYPKGSEMRGAVLPSGRTSSLDGQVHKLRDRVNRLPYVDKKAAVWRKDLSVLDDNGLREHVRDICDLLRPAYHSRLPSKIKALNRPIDIKQLEIIVNELIRVLPESKGYLKPHGDVHLGVPSQGHSQVRTSGVEVTAPPQQIADRPDRVPSTPSSRVVESKVRLAWPTERTESTVEKRQRSAPMKTFERAVPGTDAHDSVTPPLEYAGRLDVAAPAHGQVRTWGLARFFPAHTIHAQRSSAVVAGNNCRLEKVDHYHVHRMSVSFDPLLKDGSARKALQRLLTDPTDSRITEFQSQLRRLITPLHDHGRTEASMDIRPSHVTSIMFADAVQLSDGSRMNHTTRYVVEETVLPIVDLLAKDRGLVRSFAMTLQESAPGPQRAAFLKDLGRATGNVDDLALLDHSADLDTRDTQLMSLFGFAAVDRAAAIMIGSNNTMVADLRVDHPDLSRGDLLDDLGRLRRDMDLAGAVLAQPDAAMRPARRPQLPHLSVTEREPTDPAPDLAPPIRWVAKPELSTPWSPARTPERDDGFHRGFGSPGR